MSDRHLSAEVKRHSEKAFSSLITSYSKLLWVVVGSILTKENGFSPLDIEECVSDVFMVLWKQPEKYDYRKGSIKTYLCIIARSRALNLLSRSKESNTIYLDDHCEDVLVHDSYHLDDYADLYSAIDLLDPISKEVLIRRYFLLQKPGQISDIMSLPLKEVENRLYRSKGKLRKQLPYEREVT